MMLRWSARLLSAIGQGRGDAYRVIIGRRSAENSLTDNGRKVWNDNKANVPIADRTVEPRREYPGFAAVMCTTVMYTGRGGYLCQ